MTDNITTTKEEENQQQKKQQNTFTNCNNNKNDQQQQQRRSSIASTNTLSSFGISTTSDSSVPFGNSTKGLVVKTLKYSDEQLDTTTNKTKKFIPNLLLGSNVSKNILEVS